MPLVNVRLSVGDARKAAQLRKQGVEISQLVREAIRAAHEKRRHLPQNGRSAAEIMAEIYAKYPALPLQARRAYDVHNAGEARAAILGHLKRNQR